MKKIYVFFITVISISLLGCATTFQEDVMPFRNLGYLGSSIFPIQINESDWVFRVWINNGTSVDRVITVSSSSSKIAVIDEIGTLSNGKYKAKSLYNRKYTEPKSGFDSFIAKIDSLDLLNYKSQESFEYTVSHEPFSLYVIEIKKEGKYNLFEFRTHFPMNRSIENKYDSIQEILLDEFKFKFYIE